MSSDEVGGIRVDVGTTIDVGLIIAGRTGCIAPGTVNDGGEITRRDGGVKVTRGLVTLRGEPIGVNTGAIPVHDGATVKGCIVGSWVGDATGGGDGTPGITTHGSATGETVGAEIGSPG